VLAIRHYLITHQAAVLRDDQEFSRKFQCISQKRNVHLHGEKPGFDASNVKDSDASFIVIMMNLSKG
jgi:hypothetical protein